MAQFEPARRSSAGSRREDPPTNRLHRVGGALARIRMAGEPDGQHEVVPAAARGGHAGAELVGLGGVDPRDSSQLPEGYETIVSERSMRLATAKASAWPSPGPFLRTHYTGLRM